MSSSTVLIFLMNRRSSLLLVYKRPGVTSFDSLKPIKRTVDRKVGHAGTLDKFAEGLMIVLTGAFTRLNPLCSNLDKTYIATIAFGSETSTLDPEGPSIATAAVPPLQIIEQVIQEQFIGTFDQIPPQYSAVHVQGKRAYQLARAGEAVTITPRSVTIHSLRILQWVDNQLTIEVHCSKGTYIRSLARDIARACDSRGHLVALTRTAIGPFSLEEAVETSDEAQLLLHAQSSMERLKRLPHIGSLVLSDDAARRMTYGNLPHVDGIIKQSLRKTDSVALVMDQYDTLLAVTALDTDRLPNMVYSLVSTERERYD